MKAFFASWLAYLRATPVIEAVSPSTADERIAAARAETTERARLRGLSEIHRVTAENVVFFASYKNRGE